MSGDDDGLSWENVSLEMAIQILHQGETFMRAQLDATIAADQRAVTAASVFVAVATAVVAGTFAYWDQAKDLGLLFAGLVAASALTVAACLCFWSARPILFYFPGNHPFQWWPCRSADLVGAIGGETENYQGRIEHNQACLIANGRAFLRGVYVAISAPILAVLVWAAISFS